jgi:transketolase
MSGNKKLYAFSIHLRDGNTYSNEGYVEYGYEENEAERLARGGWHHTDRETGERSYLCPSAIDRVSYALVEEPPA